MSVVLIHGVPQTPVVWDRLVPLLGEERVLVPALPGFGAPRPDGFTGTKDAYAEWLAGCLRTVDGPLDLVGHEWGGLLALRLVTAPEFADLPIRSWVVDTADALHPAYRWHRHARTLQTPEHGERVLAAEQHADQAGPGSTAARLRLFGLPADQAVRIGETHDDVMTASILSLYRSAAPNLAETGWQPTGPARGRGLVVWPTADPLVVGDLATEVSDRLGAGHRRLAGVGRCWMAEEPVRAAALLREFWNGEL